MANFLLFYLAYVLAFYFARVQAFYLENALAFYLAYSMHKFWHSTQHKFSSFGILSGNCFHMTPGLLSGIDSDIFFCWHIFLVSLWQLRSSTAQTDRDFAGRTAPTGIWSWRLRSGDAHFHRELSSSGHCDPALAVTFGDARELAL